MAPSPPTQLRNNFNSSTPLDSQNTPVLTMDTSRPDLLKHEADTEKEAQAKLNRLSRKFAEITNDEGDNSSHRPKRSRHESLPAVSDKEVNPSNRTASDERLVYQAGHKFFLLRGPWICSGNDLFDTKIDKHYNPAKRFETNENKVQGQLKEIFDLLQEKFQQHALHQRWLRRQFMNGLKTQRYNTASRIRHSCASILGVSENDFLKPEVRKARFREEIGWVSKTGRYSSVDVPILHKDWCGEYSLSSIFLNPKLMGIYVALIRGPTAAKYFMSGKLLHPHTETMAQIHDIRNITPGAIATCSILARWALSSDDTFQEVGSTTGIRYFNDFENYLTLLETGLRKRKRSVINIIKQWDQMIFPDSDSSLVTGKKNNQSSGLKRALESLAADSEEEDTQQDDKGSILPAVM